MTWTSFKAGLGFSPIVDTRYTPHADQRTEGEPAPLWLVLLSWCAPAIGGIMLVVGLAVYADGRGWL